MVQAVGRIVGSLCVVSAKNGDAESAMLASWVSQASFVPPGLTVAVSNDTHGEKDFSKLEQLACCIVLHASYVLMLDNFMQKRTCRWLRIGLLKASSYRDAGSCLMCWAKAKLDLS